MRTKLLYLTILMILSSLPVLAQSSCDTVSRSYMFGVDSLEKELVIDVPAGCEHLYVRIKGGLDEGKCKVIVKNPKGLWENSLQLGYYDRNNSVSIRSSMMKCNTKNMEKLKEAYKDLSVASKKEIDNASSEINGIIVHTAHRPQEGQWSVVMIPEKAEAVIEIEYSLE